MSAGPGSYQRPRLKKPRSARTRITIRMIQRCSRFLLRVREFVHEWRTSELRDWIRGPARRPSSRTCPASTASPCPRASRSSRGRSGIARDDPAEVADDAAAVADRAAVAEVDHADPERLLAERLPGRAALEVREVRDAERRVRARRPAVGSMTRTRMTYTTPSRMPSSNLRGEAAPEARAGPGPSGTRGLGAVGSDSAHGVRLSTRRVSARSVNTSAARRPSRRRVLEERLVAAGPACAGAPSAAAARPASAPVRARASGVSRRGARGSCGRRRSPRR